MTYCVGIKAQDGIVFASDSRTNAGLDNVNIYSKMFVHDVGDRSVIIVTSGNLGTSQAVYKSIENDLKGESGTNLNTCKDFDQIASYIGSLNIKHSAPCRMARAIESRWRWPPESETPRSPTKVWYDSGRPRI